MVFHYSLVCISLLYFSVVDRGVCFFCECARGVCYSGLLKVCYHRSVGCYMVMVFLTWYVLCTELIRNMF
jgi:hypothetical protein